MRGRVAPRKLLVIRTEPLADFLQRVGVLIYDRDWRQDLAYVESAIEDTRIGSAEEMAALVREQIVAAIKQGQVDVRPVFSPVSLRKRACDTPNEPADPETISEETQDLGRRTRRPAPIDDDDEGDDRKPDWRIRSSFWNDLREPDWRESKIDIECCNIIDRHSNRSLADLYDTPPNIVAYLCVHDPDSSIRRIISYDALPDDAWFKRYNDYVSIVFRESITAAWRYAAVNGLQNEFGINEKLVANINDYCAVRGIQISEESIKNVVGKMVNQWKSNDNIGRVFVNSNRSRKQPQVKGAAARSAPKT